MLFIIMDNDNVVYCVEYNLVLALHELLERLKERDGKKYKLVRLEKERLYEKVFNKN